MNEKFVIAVMMIHVIVLGGVGCGNNGSADEDADMEIPHDEMIEDPSGEEVVETHEAIEEDIPVEHEIYELEDMADLPFDPDVEEGNDTEDALLDEETSDLPPGLVWVPIPSGSFEMGCSPGDTLCSSSEVPRHLVSVSAFLMTETEITQRQYEFVMGDNPSRNTLCIDCPVEFVTLDEARTFCEAIGGRLPSEAEWEYAARAGTTTLYYCGDDPACLDEIAWYGYNSGLVTNTVREKVPNEFGLYDTLGNVQEWVEDCWHPDYIGAPSTGLVWTGGDCVYHAVRGGSWHSSPVGLRASSRFRVGSVSINDEWGFRCAW